MGIYVKNKANVEEVIKVYFRNKFT